MAYNSSGQDILFDECKEPIDVDIFYALQEKKKVVAWKKDRHRENFIFLSIKGYTE